MHSRVRGSRDRLLAVLLYVTALSATFPSCSSPPGTHDPGYVAKEWSATMREFGIVPVFPPREDVAVGDLYLSPTPPDDELELRVISHTPGQFLPIPVLVASLDVRKDLDVYYSNRSSFPATSGAPTTQPSAIAQPHDNKSILSTGDNTRLRLGGFPEFFSAQISRGGVDGLVPTEAVNIAFGAFASANKRVRMSVPMVESYGLPAMTLLSKMKWKNDDHSAISIPIPGETTLILTGQDLAKLFAGQKYPPPNPSVIGYLRLITEVYLTRAIDVSVEAEQGSTGGLNLDPTPDLLSRLPGLAATETPSTQPTTSSAPAQPADFNKPTPQQVAAALTNQLNDSLQNALPGVSVKFLSVSAYGVSMRRTYERPVAIGYRAILLAVNADHSISVAGVSSQIIPTKKLTPEEQLKLEAAISREVSEKLKEKFGNDASAAVRIFPATEMTPTKLTAKLAGIKPVDKDAAMARARELLRQAIDARPDELPNAVVDQVFP